MKEIGNRKSGTGKGISRAYAKDLFASVKQFVRWAWGRGLIELPRNIESADLCFGGTQAKKIKVFKVDEVKALLAGATDATKLYLLLMLNCGMQQKDIADLLHDEIDLKKGLLIRKRSKTGDFETVPTVTYKLWGETFRLLKQCHSDHPVLALTTSVGKPLRVEQIENGKLSKSDNIRSAYSRLQKKWRRLI